MDREIFEGWVARFTKVGDPNDFSDFAISEWRDNAHRPDPVVALDTGPVRLEELKTDLDGSYEFLELRKGDRSETEAPEEIADYFAQGVEFQERFKESLEEPPDETS